MRAPSNGRRALVLAVISAAVGIAYVVYLRVQAFPPDIARVVPVAWLVGSVLAGMGAVRALRNQDDRFTAWLGLVLSIPSAALAVTFSIAALMGD